MADYKGRIKRGLVHSGVLSLLRRMNGPRTLVLRYHSVQETPGEYEHSIGKGIVHPAAAFTEQMEWLARTYEPTTLDDVGDSLHGGRPLPACGVLVTFDDGYTDNLETAAPVLNRLGMKAAFYITVACVEARQMPWFCRLRHAFAGTARDAWEDGGAGRVWRLADAAERRQAFLSASGAIARLAGAAQDALIARVENGLGVAALDAGDRLMMDWGQIRELRSQGHVVGSHTLTHPNLAHVGRDEAVWEMRESKRALEKELGEPVQHFSYPSPILQPHWSEETAAACAELGYRTAVTCTPGPVRAGDSPLRLKRIPAPENIDEFKWAVQCAFVGRNV